MEQTALTVLITYRLTAPVDAFRRAIAALVLRVQTQGHTGVRGYRFYVHDTNGTARAIVDYESPEAWVGHHDIAMEWPEMKALHHVATLDEVVFLGPKTKAIDDWIANSTIKAHILHGNAFAAGFMR